MAAKKETRESQYRAILERDGIRYEDCKVLAFSFDKPLGPETFHLRLMNTEPRPEYYLFDCIENVAQLVIPKDETLASRVQEIAEQMGGKKTTPNLS